LGEVRPSFLIPLAALLACLVAAPASAAKVRAARKASPRTGLIVTRDDELVRAATKKDRGALERVAERMGPGHLGEALRRSDPMVVAAALVALPLARGAVLQIGAVADLLDSSNPSLAAAAARILGQLLDGAEPGALEDWEVPPDMIERACGGLRGLAGRVDAPSSSRVAALLALASAPTCSSGGDLSALLRDPTPAVRRATALVLRADERRSAGALREVIRDPERSVVSAAVATLCRDEPGDLAAGAAPPKTEPPAPVVMELARVMVAARGTPIADAVEMLGCLARASTPADRQIMEQLRRGPASPLRDRAAELIIAQDRLKSQ
jgi:hypothetical protein